MEGEGLSYKASGVDYDKLDWFKRYCQKKAYETKKNLARSGFAEPEKVRGESAYLVETESAYWAHVEEGLGTKNIVADQMLALTGVSYYAAIGVDTVAAIVNDLITSGALPVVVAMHAAVGDAAWFTEETRARDLAEGFARGCELAGAVWGGGETPALKGLVHDAGVVLAGSAMGRVEPKSRRIVGDIGAGDKIVCLHSSGIHTNGLTLCRKIAERLPNGLLTELEDGRSFGESLLDPSVIYAKFIAACQRRDATPKYAIHMTGHGWRKLMRADGDFVYEIDKTPPLKPIFRFILDRAGVDMKEAYGTFNMGVGFAVIVSADMADDCARLAQGEGYEAYVAGTVRAGNKSVVLRDRDIVFEEASLNIKS